MGGERKECIDTNEVETLKFLRLNQINKYNLEMGGVDIADQLRGVYRIDRWVRNWKWWWSILFWSIGVSRTNAWHGPIDARKKIVQNFPSQHDLSRGTDCWVSLFTLRCSRSQPDLSISL